MKTLFIVASLILVLFLVAPSNIEAQQKSSVAQKQVLPKFRKGTPYPTVRKELLKFGWEPVTMPTATPCGEDDSRCQGFTEVYFCSGVGQAICIYTWKKKTSANLVVWASGEGVQTFYGLGLCSRHQTQVVPECGGREPAPNKVEGQNKKPTSHSDFQTFWNDFKKAVKEGDIDAVAKMTNIPFKDKYREELYMVDGIGKPRTSNSVDEFRDNYNRIFTPKVVTVINSNKYIGWESRKKLGNSSNDLKKGERLLLFEYDEGLSSPHFLPQLERKGFG